MLRVIHPIQLRTGMAFIHAGVPRYVDIYIDRLANLAVTPSLP